MRIVPWVLIVVTLPLLVPIGAAQGGAASIVVTTRSDDSLMDGRLTPETELARVPIRGWVEFSALTACVSSLQLLFQIREAPAYATVVLNPSAQSVTPEPVSVTPYRRGFDAEVMVATNRDAPAFHDGKYTIRAELRAPGIQSGCNLPPVTQGTGAFTIKNNYVPGIRVEAGEPQPSGTGGTIDLLVTNLANGPTIVRAELLPLRAQDFAALVAPELRLESRIGRGEDAIHQGTITIAYELNGVTMAPFRVRLISTFDGAATPEARWEETLVDLVATSEVPLDEAHAEEFEEPAYVPMPAFLAVLGILGALFARRRG